MECQIFKAQYCKTTQNAARISSGDLFEPLSLKAAGSIILYVYSLKAIINFKLAYILQLMGLTVVQ